MYKKGQSGNPKGKPKGVMDKRLKVRRMLEEHSEELVAKVVTMALDGDPVALKLCMERISPKPSAESINLDIDVSNVKTSNDLKDLIIKVISSAVTGLLPDAQGKAIASLAKTFIDIDSREKDIEEMRQIKEDLEQTQKDFMNKIQSPGQTIYPVNDHVRLTDNESST